MSPELVTAPTEAAIFELVDADLLKQNLRVRHSKEDDLLEHWITTAHNLLDGLDGWARRPILQATYRQAFNGFARDLELQVLGATSIESVTYEGGVDPVDAASYSLLLWRRAQYLRFGSAYTFPDVSSAEVPGTVVVTYKAKCDRARPNLKQGILLLASHWYRNREESFADPRQSLTNHRIEWGLKATLGRFQAPLRLEGV